MALTVVYTWYDTKEWSISVNLRSKDNTMAKRKRTKGQIMICKTLHGKQKIEQHKPTKNQVWTQVLRKGGISLSNICTRRITLITNPMINREWGKDLKVFATSGTYPWSLVAQLFVTVNKGMVATVKLSTSI